MSDMSATVTPTDNGFHVDGYEKITYDFRFVDHIFDPKKSDLADCYKTWGRCLVIIDNNVHKIHSQALENYFSIYNIKCTIKVIESGELRKTMKTKLEIIDTFAEYGLVRKEPVLVIGGGVLTDVAGYACASYRRKSNFIRIPTTLIGLIDASVSIKVGLNHEKLKNRLGAYHAPIMTFLDFSFLKTLSEGHIRNGFAELIKISVVGEKTVFDLLDKYGEELISTRFGYLDGSSDEIRHVGKQINYLGIKKMLELEVPNLHEVMLDRVIAFGHTWSPTLELTPTIPLRHGHAINIDMAFSVTIAWKRHLISIEERDRILHLMSRVGLTLDHKLFQIELIWKAMRSIMLTRDGHQRAAMPYSIGQCIFLNDLTHDELESILREHKEIVKVYPRSGDGLDAYIDQNDYTEISDSDAANMISIKELNGEAVLDLVSSTALLTKTIEMNGFTHTNILPVII
ncbi:unnamed protein product [Adineta steineri]|uniref:3-dehydroquinate synthase domain-containing protein n=1 Tax=Adineta steineri TaxID=433720 RepID=A0A813X0R2_9BILA|nr:unnamed protein product [Adineta steineri]CAF0863312.1 unnamed protein product [Adineta steineri]